MAKGERDATIEIHHGLAGTPDGKQTAHFVVFQAIGPEDEVQDLYEKLSAFADEWSGKPGEELTGQDAQLAIMPPASGKVN